ncbi:MAG: hypothetical protein OEW12_01595 [Deltaproteobacteria bacterium]|nr:hypothetical protein [Deltaproteobacteria bacterium]
MESLTHFADSWFPAAAAVFVVGFGWRMVRLLRLPRPKDIAPPKGDAAKGAVYALTFAMLPWKKESTRIHWVTYTAGMAMHLGLFLAILYALVRLAGWSGPGLDMVMQGAAPMGWAAAFGLFVKRIFKRSMRAISTPDDFVSSLLVQGVLLGAWLTALDGGWWPLWKVAAMALMVYIPLGKLFHMVLFFFSRVFFGRQFGSRGVLRHAAPVSY